MVIGKRKTAGCAIMNEQVKRGFKKKTICEIIDNKVSEWIKSLPEELRDEVNDDFILTGGAIPSMLLGDLPNDYDIYFQTTEVAKKVVDYYLSKYIPTNLISRIESTVEPSRVRIMIKSAGILGSPEDSNDDYRYFESLPPEEAEKFFKKREYVARTTNPKYVPLNITSNAITLDGDIQLILRFVGDPGTIHMNFDFEHATSYYTNKTGLVLNKNSLECILAKELKYNSSKYPLCAMFRLKKFIKRGWTITAGEMFKIGYDISKLDLDNIEVLEDQLTGVDQAYFQEVIRKLKGQDREIDRTYLFEMINRVF